jgi:acyl-CoA thioester hydrolase
VSRFTATIVAGDADIDELGHVNNAVWVRWIQDVAVAHWAAVAPPEQVARYVWVVTRHEIDYRGNVSAGERVTAETWVADAPRGARFDRLMRFTGEDGRVRVEARTTWAMIDRTSGRLVRVTPEIAAPFLEDASTR